jgi:hypothetical protein
MAMEEGRGDGREAGRMTGKVGRRGLLLLLKLSPLLIDS